MKEVLALAAVLIVCKVLEPWMGPLATILWVSALTVLPFCLLHELFGRNGK